MTSIYTAFTTVGEGPFYLRIRAFSLMEVPASALKGLEDTLLNGQGMIVRKNNTVKYERAGMLVKC